jgi:hypothetical protein
MNEIEERIMAFIKAELEENPKLTFSEAFNRVTAKNPALSNAYLTIARGENLPPDEITRVARCLRPLDISEVRKFDNPATEFTLLIAKKMKEKPDLDYGQAMNEVGTENPELVKRYMASPRDKKALEAAGGEK